MKYRLPGCNDVYATKKMMYLHCIYEIRVHITKYTTSVSTCKINKYSMKSRKYGVWKGVNTCMSESQIASCQYINMVTKYESNES